MSARDITDEQSADERRTPLRLCDATSAGCSVAGGAHRLLPTAVHAAQVSAYLQVHLQRSRLVSHPRATYRRSAIAHVRAMHRTAMHHHHWHRHRFALPMIVMISLHPIRLSPASQASICIEIDPCPRRTQAADAWMDHCPPTGIECIERILNTEAG